MDFRIKPPIFFKLKTDAQKLLLYFILCFGTTFLSFSQPTNIDFQTGNISGWTVQEASNSDSYLMTVVGSYSTSTNYSVMIPGSTEIKSVPINMISPLGGNFVRFGDYVVGGLTRKLAQTFSVTNTESALSVCYAVVMEDGTHACNEQAFFHFTLRDQFGNIIPQTNTYYNVCGGRVGGSFSNAGGVFYSNWETHSFDLSQYIGTNVTIESKVSGCYYLQGAHFGYAYFDAKMCSASITPNILSVNGSTTTLIQSKTDITVCGSNTASIIAPSGATGYTWTGTGISGITSSSVSITQPGVYNLVMDKSSACSPTTAVTFSVGLTPTISVTGNTFVCSGGGSTILTASGASNYTWTPYSLNMLPVGGFSSSITITPTVTTIYTVTGTSSSGCSNTQTYSVFYSSSPSPTLSITGNAVLCRGSSSTLTASGANTYSWSSGATTSSIVVSPSVTTTYTLSGTTTSSGCNSKLLKYITVYTNTIGIASSNFSICEGSNTSLYGIGAQTYTWSTGSIVSSTVVQPTVNSTYTLIGTNVCGTFSATTQVFVKPISTTINCAPSFSICKGSSATLSASGCTGYTWSPSATLSNSTSATTVASPTTSTVYFLTVTNSTGCLRTYNNTVSVYNNSISISPTSFSACSGSSVSLTGSGSQTYTWSTSQNTSSIVVTPTTSTTYILTGNNACGTYTTSSTASVSIVSLSITSSGTSFSICPGSYVSLTAAGALSYTWSPSTSLSSTNSAVVLAYPSTSTTYSVKGKNSAGCINTKTVVLSVLPNYILNTSVSQASVCIGASSILQATGATNYTWNPGAMVNQTVSVTPLITTLYTVTASNSNGCVKTHTQNVIVYPDYDVVIDNSSKQNCIDVPINLVANVSPSGTYTYSWFPDTYLSNNSISNPEFLAKASVKNKLYLDVINSNGCNKRDSIIINVNLCDIKFYTGFSPNNDGHNESWIIDGIEAESNNSVVILNKWGNEVWSIKGYNNTAKVWKGKNLKGEELPDGTYFYVVTTAEKTYKGRVELIR
jgi:gliding motility-associated-like protein